MYVSIYVSIHKIYITYLYLCICVCNVGLFSVDNAESCTKSNPIKSRVCSGPLAHLALQDTGVCGCSPHADDLLEMFKL